VWNEKNKTGSRPRFGSDGGVSWASSLGAVLEDTATGDVPSSIHEANNCTYAETDKLDDAQV
jgi:hypothetical protein